MAYLIISMATGLGVKVLLVAENSLIAGGGAARGGESSGGLKSEKEGLIPFLTALEALAASLILD